MPEQTLHLTSEEVSELLLILNRETATAAVAMHHTATRDYRERIRHRMDLIASMLTKLDANPVTEPQSA